MTSIAISQSQINYVIKKDPKDPFTNIDYTLDPA